MFVKLVVTGTGTGAGKTVITTLLCRRVAEHGYSTAAFKPLCSGGRDDARALHRAAGGGLSLDIVNPWHFRAPLAPRLAARLEGKRILLRDVAAHIRRHSRGVETVLVECAGGLLSPLAEDGDAPELIRALDATPVVVAANRLGVVHDVRATLHALPPAVAGRAVVVLNGKVAGDRSCRHNAALLGEYLDAARIFEFPQLKSTVLEGGRIPAALRALLDRILGASGIHPGT